MVYNSHIHRRNSIRLRHYDYSQEGMYFITICTKDRKSYFGKIVDHQMVLNEKGRMAKLFWYKIGKIHNFVELKEFVIMPNHIHGIIILKNQMKQGDLEKYEKHNLMVYHSFKPKSISSLIGHYKAAVKKWMNNNNYGDFCWQRNYYEHIIRDDNRLKTISHYIVNNPKNWKEDRFFP
ncbi:transposase [Candidatus Peregrinibacteria bacterium]|nr:MAG: transposase [Candidatus Peregrinibacteria bacterium]